MAQVERLIANSGHGDAKRTIKLLMRENHAGREAKRKAEERVRELETAGRVAPEGGAVLTADEAKAWKLIQTALNEGKLTAEQAIEKITKHAELSAEIAKRDREQLIEDAAGEVDYNGPALVKVLAFAKLDLEMRETTVEVEGGKKEKRKLPHVRAAGDGKAEWSLLTEHVEEHLKEFLPALQAEGEEEGGTSNARPAARRPATGTPFPKQRKAETAPPAAKSEEELRKSAIKSGIYAGI